MRELTRDSDLYNDALRTRVINKASFESVFDEIIDFDYTYNFKYTVKWDLLEESGVLENITPSKLKSLKNMSKTELAEHVGKETFHSWKGYGSTKIIVYIKASVILPDGEKIKVIYSNSVDSVDDYNKIHEILECINSSRQVNVEINDKKSYTIDTDRYRLNTERAGNHSTNFETISSKNKKKELMHNYFSGDGPWVKATVQKPKENGEIIRIPVTYNEQEVSVNFRNPESNDDFWNVVEKLGGGDPLLIEDEEVYLSHSAITNQNALFSDDIWKIRANRPKKLHRNRLISYIQGLLS